MKHRLHKAAYERVMCMPYEMDEIDHAILAGRIAEWQRHDGGPRVGEFVITSKGYLRFTHDWGDDIQTTVAPGYD